MSDDIPSLAEAMAEIRRLRERCRELEAAAAMQRGTLAQPSDDGPATITHGHAPSAPPHNEQPSIGNADE
jgi:Xaa-Pro aminopeptidase